MQGSSLPPPPTRRLRLRKSRTYFTGVAFGLVVSAVFGGGFSWAILSTSYDASLRGGGWFIGVLFGPIVGLLPTLLVAFAVVVHLNDHHADAREVAPVYRSLSRGLLLVHVVTGLLVQILIVATTFFDPAAMLYATAWLVGTNLVAFGFLRGAAHAMAVTWVGPDATPLPPPR
jgi:hypothetical protein